MTSHKQVWIAALCLLSAIAVALAFTVRTTKVQAAKHIASKSPTSLAQPAVYLAGSALPGALMDDDGPVRVGAAQLSGRTIFPPVQEFTLTPPNPGAGIDKTILTVRFPEAQTAKLPSNIPMTLAKQNVILQRSAAAANVFLTSLDFNWQRFVEEQAQRKIAASQGRKVSIFDGRKYVRTETMQYVDPSQIQRALQSHQPVQFSGGVLSGSPNFFVYPDHELMITNTAVVEDTGSGTGNGRTYDQCLAQLNPPQNPGNPNGAWTLNTLMQQIACSGGNNCTPGTTAAQQLAENMLLSMFSAFSQDQGVNGIPPAFTVLHRPAIGQLNVPGSGLLANWTVDSSAPNNGCTFQGRPSPCPSLPMAPVRLDAIVNRIDLGENLLSPPTPGGELRFVFSVTADTGSGESNPSCHNNTNPSDRINTFNIILEYNVPGTIDALTWATNWIALQTVFNPNLQNDFNPNYLTALNNITNQVVLPNRCTNGTASCIAQIRTNEFLLRSGANACCWEQRQFQLNPGTTPTLVEGTVAMTPDPQFNNNHANPPGQPLCNLVNGQNMNPGPCTPLITGDYINAFGGTNLFMETQGAAPAVQDDFNGQPFLGGSALQEDSTFPTPGPAFWNDTDITQGPPARIYFSLNTCNGCHGRETNTGFVQVSQRLPNTASELSSFLVGCANGGSCNPVDSLQCVTSLPDMVNQNVNGCTESVTDPVNQQSTNFGDLQRRVGYLLMTCGAFNNNQCTGGTGSDLLLPFTNKPIGVH